ncbi:MAG: prolyl oligopeptidase family serine peptidase [Caldilineaceae bacterium]
MSHEGQIGVAFASGGHKLIGTLFLAAGDDPKPTAILLHGCPGFEKNHDIAYALRQRGWNSLVFHYRGCWGSAGDYLFQTIPDDVQAAMDHLQSGCFPQVDGQRLMLVGSSLGGWAAIITAARDPRPQAVAVYGTAVSLGQAEMSDEVIEQEFAPWLTGMTPAAFNTQRLALTDEFQPLRQVSKIAPRPLLIINGDADAWTPASGARALYDAAEEPKELFIIPGGNHYLAWHRAELCQIVVEWLMSK